MTPDEVEQAKQILRGNPTRPRYRDDEEVIVRRNDLGAAERDVVERYAHHTGATKHSPTHSPLRESESIPLLGDVEYRFSVAAVDEHVAPN